MPVCNLLPPYTFAQNLPVSLVFTDSETRRQAASDFTRALMEQFETQVTAIVTRYIGAYLQVRLGYIIPFQVKILTAAVP